jgi:hypothetical protein
VCVTPTFFLSSYYCFPPSNIFLCHVVLYVVLELCGDELANLSRLEMLKHEELKFQVVDGPEIPDIEDNTYDIEIIDDDIIEIIDDDDDDNIFF